MQTCLHKIIIFHHKNLSDKVVWDLFEKKQDTQIVCKWHMAINLPLASMFNGYKRTYDVFNEVSYFTKLDIAHKAAATVDSLLSWNYFALSVGSAIRLDWGVLIFARGLNCRTHCRNQMHFRSPCYSHGLNLILLWAMPSKVWDEITYPFPNFKGTTVEFREWVTNFIPHFIKNTTILSY